MRHAAPSAPRLSTEPNPAVIGRDPLRNNAAMKGTTGQGRLQRGSARTPARGRLVVAVILAILLTACSGASTPATPGKGAGSAALDRTKVELVNSDANVTITAVQLAGEPEAELKAITGIPLAAGVPTEIAVEGALPEGGVRITRSYDNPLPAEATATLAYFDEELGSWVAVPSTIADDRRSVTATVHHLSWWTDLVSATQDAWETTTKVVTDAADWAYYQVGAIFDVRVDAPGCDQGSPGWVASVTAIEYHENNPVLFCDGIDGGSPDLMVVKARVNRGFGMNAALPAGASWRSNSTYGETSLEDILTILGDLGTVYADSFRDLTADGTMVGPGQELALGVSEDAVRGASDGVVLRLEPQRVPAFLITSLGSLIGSEIGGNADGYVAAIMATASCAAALSQATDGAGLAGAGLTCASGAETTIAQNLATYLQRRGVADAGKVAGKIVGKITVYLGLLGPTFNAMNYFAELHTDAAARTVTVTPQAKRPTASAPAGQTIDATSTLAVGGSASFATPSGDIVCTLSLGQWDTPSTASCQGGWLPDGTGPEKDYCASTRLGIGGVLLDFQGGWLCAGGIVLGGPAPQQQWWQGRGFPTTNSQLFGNNQAVLPIGSGLTVGNVTCLSRSDGVTCQNAGTGAAFHTSATQTTFSGPQHQVYGDHWAGG